MKQPRRRWNHNRGCMSGPFKKIHVNQYEERTAELLTKQAQEENRVSFRRWR